MSGGGGSRLECVKLRVRCRVILKIVLAASSIGVRYYKDITMGIDGYIKHVKVLDGFVEKELGSSVSAFHYLFSTTLI